MHFDGKQIFFETLHNLGTVQNVNINIHDYKM